MTDFSGAVVGPLVVGECKVSVQFDGLTPTVSLVGTADMRATEGLGALLDKLHAEAITRKTATVVVDMRDLEFMNSSCFKSFVTWIMADREADSSYRIRFLSNPKLHWQKRSLPTLKCFAADLISIEE